MCTSRSPRILSVIRRPRSFFCSPGSHSQSCLGKLLHASSRTHGKIVPLVFTTNPRDSPANVVFTMVAAPSLISVDFHISWSMSRVIQGTLQSLRLLWNPILRFRSFKQRVSLWEDFANFLKSNGFRLIRDLFSPVLIYMTRDLNPGTLLEIHALVIIILPCTLIQLFLLGMFAHGSWRSDVGMITQGLFTNEPRSSPRSWTSMVQFHLSIARNPTSEQS